MKLATAYFAGGCFWCTEAVFTMLRGVKSVAPGYAGGTVANPTYEQVSSGTTGHAEVIKFEYDPEQISYDDLLNVFFATHDPTTLNRQGNDVGTQYRSAIFYENDSQKQQAVDFIRKYLDPEFGSEKRKEKSGAIVTTLEPLTAFYPAEDYHQKYYENNKDEPYCQLVINPKLEKVKQKFAQLLHD